MSKYLIRDAGVILSHHTTEEAMHDAFDCLPRAIKHSCVLECAPSFPLNESATAKTYASNVAYLATVEENRKANASALTKAKQEAETERIVRR